MRDLAEVPRSLETQDNKVQVDVPWEKTIFILPRQ